MTGRRLLDALRGDDPGGDAHAKFGTLTRRLATSAVRRLRRPGGGSWTADDVADLTQKFWESGRSTKVILHATDDEHLAALITRSIKHVAIDDLRKAGESGVRDRVIDVLKKGPFERFGEAWGTPGSDAGHRFQGSESSLVEAAWEVPVTLLRVRTDSKRRSSYASREDLEAVINTVLKAATAPVPLTTLVTVCSNRLGEVLAADAESDIELEGPEPDPADTAVGTSVAEALWVGFTESQKAVVPYVDQTTRDAAEIVGLGRSAVNVAQNAVKKIVSDECRDMDDGERIAVVRALCDLHATDIGAGQNPQMLRRGK